MGLVVTPVVTVRAERGRSAQRTRVTVMTILLLSAMALLGACEGSILGIRGDGEVATETRAVSGFDRVDLRGSGTVRIEITGTESLTIEAEGNLIEYLTTEVSNGTLTLDATRSISPTEEIVYTITAVGIEALSISGSGDILAESLTGEALRADVSGSGSITVPDAVLGAATIDISGSGDVRMTGEADSVAVAIAGSGSVDAADLIADSGAVSIAGSGNAVVHVTGRLDAAVSGSGDVVYLGDPSVDASTTGSGSIRPG